MVKRIVLPRCAMMPQPGRARLYVCASAGQGPVMRAPPCVCFAPRYMLPLWVIVRVR